MHKLIILGNGFDLAHDLKTSYDDYMAYLMDLCITKELEPKTGQARGVRKINLTESSPNNYFTIPFKGEEHPFLIATIDQTKQGEKRKFHTRKESILFKELLSNFQRDQKWSSFEELYGKLLYKHQKSASDVDTLNEELKIYKDGLEDYLAEQIEDSVIGDDLSKMHRREILKILESGFNNNIRVKDYTILSFNYTTKLIEHYLKGLIGKQNNFLQIHGRLRSSEIPVIFGFGNENTPEYQELESRGKSELLKNFKTFQYLRSTYYRSLLSILAGAGHRGVYVQVIGHSLGLTDKTLLRTVFQHDSVRDIELVYHEKSENYFELSYNASRLFDNNEMMREKIVPLEQTRSIQKS